MESGRRWKDEDIPKTEWELARFLWQPEAEMYGIQRIEYLDDVLILSGSGVGGGSHVYANTLYVPPKHSSTLRNGRVSLTGPTNPEKIHITPGSISITSGVWPDAVTSIEPTIWGGRQQCIRDTGDTPPARRTEAPHVGVAQTTRRTSDSSAWRQRPAPLV